MLSLSKITLTPKAAAGLRAGYPWLRQGDIESKQSLPPGSLVQFVEGKSAYVATGYFNPNSYFAGRVLTRNKDETIDTEFFICRFKKAAQLRDALFNAPYYRLIHAEGDFLPGLTIDRFGDILVCQLSTAGMDALKTEIVNALQHVLKPHTIVLRGDIPARVKEGLEETVEVIGKPVPERVKLIENGHTYLADLSTGQKTGWYYDQRPHREFIASLAKSKTLVDIFSYTGGFGLLAAARGAKHVTFVDSSAPALAIAKENAPAHCDFIHGKAIKVMEQLEKDGAKFDIVLVDPPAFAKSRKDTDSARKAYRRLAWLAAAITAPGGVVFTATCSHHFGPELLMQASAQGFAKAGRGGAVIFSHGAGGDHPVHPLLPESAYLHGLTFAMD